MPLFSDFVISFECFIQYDVDGDGRIALHEFRTILRSNQYHHDIPERVAMQIIKNADIDKNGFLEFNEFLKLVSML